MKEQEYIIQLHNKLIDLADLVIYHYDPCKIKDGKCVVGGNPIPCCVGSKFKRKDYPENNKCQFLGPNGCTAKNIDCRSWLCDEVKKQTDPKCVAILEAIEKIARVYEFITD